MRIAVYGGSFDPPHVGHAMVAGWLRWTDLADRVWLLPAAAHAFDKEMRPFALRVRFCQALAAAVGPWVEVCDIEGDLPAPNYTIDTLTVLSDRHPEHRFRLCIGSDNLQVVDRWKDWDRIRAGFDPIVAGRQGYPIPAGTVAFPEVSSTEVRRRVAAGEPVDHLVPAAVRALFGDVYSSTPRPTMP